MRSKRVKKFVKKKSKTLDREQYAREKLSKLPQIFERVRKKTLHFTTAGTDGYFCNFVRNAAREAEAEMRLEENLADWKRSVNITQLAVCGCNYTREIYDDVMLCRRYKAKLIRVMAGGHWTVVVQPVEDEEVYV